MPLRRMSFFVLLAALLVMTATVLAVPASSADAARAKPPGVPRSVKVVPGEGSVRVSWQAPAKSGGAKITAYLVRTATKASGPWKKTAVQVGGAKRTATVTGLTNGTTYYVRVYARNKAGTGPGSKALKAVPRGVPGKPTALTVTPGNATATLSWSAPPANGAPITGYVVQQKFAEIPWTTIGTPSDPAFTATGLQNLAYHSFRVQAQNAVGVGPASDEVGAVPLDPPPVAPTLTAVEVTMGTATLDWDFGWNGPADFRVERLVGDDWVLVGSTTLTAGEFAVNVTTVSESFTFRVRATNAGGSGPPSESIAVRAGLVPSEPVLTATTAGPGSITASWALDTIAGRPPTEKISYGAHGPDQTISIHPPTLTTSHTFEGLSGGVTYEVRVTACAWGTTGSNWLRYQDGQLHAYEVCSRTSTNVAAGR